MVHLLFIESGDALTKPGVARTVSDLTAGTGGMRSVAGESLYELTPKPRITPAQPVAQRGREASGAARCVARVVKNG